jgi:hypothetical protein
LWIETGSLNDSLWSGQELCRSINPDSATDELIEIKLHQNVTANAAGRGRRSPRLGRMAAAPSEPPALRTAASRLLLERPRLALAPSQRTGKDHEHHNHGCGNQHRIDGHNYLLLISPKRMANSTRRSLTPIKLAG